LVHVQTSYDIAQPLDSAAFFQFGGDFQAYTSSWLALTHLLLGYPDKAQAVYENALILTEKQPYPHSFVLGFAFIPQLKNNIPETIKRAQELIGLSERYAFVLLGLQGNIFNAWVMATAQENPLGVQILESITPVPKMVKLDSFVPWYLALLGQAQSVHGKQESAVQSIDEALTYAESAGGNFYQAELHRVKGDILKAQGSPSDTVEQQYREALALARSQSARWWELRAATSLAELLIEQEQSRAAYDLLAPVFNWFTEGFDSPDLIKAQSLLSNLQ
jgi:tetratricopeptide (TPR) repeat protein